MPASWTSTQRPGEVAFCRQRSTAILSPLHLRLRLLDRPSRCSTDKNERQHDRRRSVLPRLYPAPLRPCHDESDCFTAVASSPIGLKRLESPRSSFLPRPTHDRPPLWLRRHLPRSSSQHWVFEGPLKNHTRPRYTSNGPARSIRPAAWAARWARAPGQPGPGPQGAFQQLHSAQYPAASPDTEQ